ncbi:hypothetical protein [Sinomonas terrae]|uniref:DUF8175 domain-containing protein n=1 Tax=Sinomonas terrae TaxID=2908838 RepID=A0ABS9U7F2_9MICC|nr:hypothetical protein [Sinomonas terrae]MCH6472466.1 hypothetical protein [Sinomonas terrae]
MKKPNQKLTLWAAGLVAAVIVVMAVLVAVTPTQSSPQSSGGSGQAVPETTPSAPAGCSAPTDETSNKPAPPSDLRWEASKGWTWPVSDTYGPTQHRDGLGVCFARSPLGAALAMTTILASFSTSPDLRSVTDQYIVDSPGKTAILAQISAPRTPQAPLAFAGYKVDSFSSDEAQITVVLKAPGGSDGYIGMPTTLRWADADWKVKLLDNGNFFAGSPTTVAAGSFTSWGAS